MAKVLNAQSTPVTKAPPEDGTFSLISNEKLLTIYEVLLKCRLLQQYARDLFQQGKLDTDLHLSSGREASAVSVCIDLLPADMLSIVSPDWLPAFVKGIRPEALFRLLSPALRSDNQPLSRFLEAEHTNILVARDALEQPELVAKRMPRGRSRKQNDILAVFLSPRKDSLGHWTKFITAAAQKNYPVVLVHHVSGDPDAATSAVQRKTKNPQALFNGLPSISVDAADPVALYRVAYEAIVRARQGRGATLIQCLAIQETSPSQSASGLSSPCQADPISALEAYLRAKGIEPEQHSRQVVTDFHRELELATRFLDR